MQKALGLRRAVPVLRRRTAEVENLDRLTELTLNERYLEIVAETDLSTFHVNALARLDQLTVDEDRRLHVSAQGRRWLRHCARWYRVHRDLRRGARVLLDELKAHGDLATDPEEMLLRRAEHYERAEGW